MKKIAKYLAIVVALAAIALTSYTSAYYISNAEGGAQARVAKYAITVSDLKRTSTDATIDCGSTSDTVKYTFTITNNSEVNVNYTVKATIPHTVITGPTVEDGSGVANEHAVKLPDCYADNILTATLSNGSGNISMGGGVKTVTLTLSLKADSNLKSAVEGLDNLTPNATLSPDLACYLENFDISGIQLSLDVRQTD